MHVLTDNSALVRFGIFLPVVLLFYCCLDPCIKKNKRNKKNRLAENTNNLIKRRLKKKISDEFYSYENHYNIKKHVRISLFKLTNYS